MAVPNDNNRRMLFDLNTVDDPEFTKFLDSVGEDRVCVVSVIGKSSLRGGSCKASCIDEAVMLNIFQKSLFPDIQVSPDLLCNIEGFYDVEGRVIFLHHSGIFDSNYLIKACSFLDQDLNDKGFLEVWSDLQTKQAKALLLLFQISHIIIVVHPTATFDVSYIQLFRTLDSVRQKAVPNMSDQLSCFSVSSDWVSAGRPCSPRVLFVFQTCPLTGKIEELLGDAAICARSKSPPPIKKLEHSLEDQIYHILRKSRVITNVSGNSLFAVPANQEFVYVVLIENRILDPVDFFLSQMREHSQQTKEIGDGSVNAGGNIKRYTLNRRGSNHSSSSLSSGTFDLNGTEGGCGDHSFRAFLWQHIDLALGKGFDDNVGRHPVPAYFELPKAKVWFQIFRKMKEWFLKEPSDNRTKGIMTSLKTMLDVDGRFSEGRCGKVLPMASATYQDNLPSHYTEDYHQRKLLQALQVFALQARGPAYQRYAQQLKEECERLWKKGHQMCEQLSLSGNHCINPLHRTDQESESDPSEKSLPTMPHFSQIKLVSVCDCGRRQASRDDPFDVKTANNGFYVSLHKDCCGLLERIPFPVFQPSPPSPESATSAGTPQEKGEEEELEGPQGQDPDCSPPLLREAEDDMSPVATPDGRQEDQDEDDEAEETEQDQESQISPSLSASETSESLAEGSASNRITQPDAESGQQKEESGKVIIKINEATELSKEKGLARQSSTTEYLPGMLHSASPPGLLPAFPSWSLVCLGPSSLYSHNIGIQDQPGFISGTNYLLPWDVTVKVEQRERWPSVWEGKRLTGVKAKKGGHAVVGRDNSQFMVKIFIGVEYECPRSHRFMCSSPDRLLRPSSSGLVKENANQVTGNDMPLYFPCPCRPSKPNIAQLMRIHVVTPKAPVHVTLDPRVQPAPSPCPVFTSGHLEPIKLSQSAYWVLRLPFVYEGPQGPILPPKEPLPVEACRLIKGTYGIAQVVAQEKLPT